MDEAGKLLWTPSEITKKESQLYDYMQWLRKQKRLEFHNYEELWQWSIDHLADFWESLWTYFDIQSHTPYTSVLEYAQMPEVQWFQGSTLNYAEHIFRNATSAHPAILFQSERQSLTEISWDQLRSDTAKLQHFLKQVGVQQGDRVVAFLPNIPEATVSFLATNALGAVWSSCSPDFGASSVLDRFKQIEPKVLIAVDGYTYGGKSFVQKKVCKTYIF